MRIPFLVAPLAVALLSVFAGSADGDALALSAVNIQIGDDFFCSPAFEDGVCPTTINAGDAVTWSYVSGSSAHTTTGSPYWNSGILTPGDSFAFTFSTPGTYSYRCNLHPDSMRGTVTVLASASPPSQPSAPEQSAAPPPPASPPEQPAQAQTSGFTPPPALGPGSLPLPEGTAPGALPSGGAFPQPGEPSPWWLVILAGTSFILYAGLLTYFSLRHR